MPTHIWIELNSRRWVVDSLQGVRWAWECFSCQPLVISIEHIYIANLATSFVLCLLGCWPVCLLTMRGSHVTKWQSHRKISLGPVRRACPASGASWNVQVVRGKMTSKCLWHACQALAIGFLLMIIGAGMATIGNYDRFFLMLFSYTYQSYRSRCK